MRLWGQHHLRIVLSTRINLGGGGFRLPLIKVKRMSKESVRRIKPIKSTMRKPKSERYKTGEKAITIEQVQALLSLKDIPLLEEGLLRLAINGGLRREDIVNVRQADVKEAENLVVFNEAKKRRTWQVYVSDDTMKTLSQIKRQVPSLWMFPAANPKRHLSSKTAYNILQRNLAKIGVESRPFHALRATCIKLCQRAGWSPEQTSRHVGDTIRVIQEHYSTPSLEEMKDVVKQKPLI